MQVAETIAEVRAHVADARRSERRIGFVPTMGALHEGHLSLIRTARRQCDDVVVSIFVNPTQFAPGEDYERYPRALPDDLAACRQAGVDLVFAPSVEQMYGPEPLTTVHTAKLTERLCGAHRPGHFDGVTTVVAKLFNIVQPDVAYFGQKDAQQAVVIKKMVADLNFPIEIVVCPTVREPDGLAMSSRNAYLSAPQRRQARALYQALLLARREILAGQRDPQALIRQMREHITAAGPCTIDYIEIVDPERLTPLETIRSPALVTLAVRIGPARLIDNLLVDPSRPAQ